MNVRMTHGAAGGLSDLDLNGNAAMSTTINQVAPDRSTPSLGGHRIPVSPSLPRNATDDRS